MTTPLPRIEVGKCYRDRFGAVFRVTGIDGETVEFMAYMKSTDRLEAAYSGTEALSLFLRDLQQEVPCPGAAPQGPDGGPARR